MHFEHFAVRIVRIRLLSWRLVWRHKPVACDSDNKIEEVILAAHDVSAVSLLEEDGEREKACPFIAVVKCVVAVETVNEGCTGEKNGRVQLMRGLSALHRSLQRTLVLDSRRFYGVGGSSKLLDQSVMDGKHIRYGEVVDELVLWPRPSRRC